MAGSSGEEEEYRWGSSKADYYGADAIETEQDALMEEEESKRIQQKRLQSMNDADFGLDEDLFDSDDDAEATRTKFNGDDQVEKIQQLVIAPNTSPAEQLNILYDRYPEFRHLITDFLQLKPLHDDLSAKVATIKSVEAAQAGPQTKWPSSVQSLMLKQQALSAYMASIAMYLAIVSAPEKRDGHTGVSIAPHALRKHPIMEYILSSRESWQKTQSIDVSDVIAFPESETGLSDSQDEVGQLDRAASPDPTPRKRKRKLSRAQKAAQAALEEAQAQRQERIRQTQENMAGLDALLAQRTQSRTSNVSRRQARDDSGESDFGEEAPMTVEEAAEKAKRKKSLRFYTSQIAQKINMRDTKGRAAGGDDDLPYRERLKDRQARLNEQAAKRGKAEKKADEQLGGESDEEDRRTAKGLRQAEVGSGDNDKDDDDDYYDMIAARTEKKKVANRERAEAYALAGRQNARAVEVEAVGADGKRGVTYQIEKNKGMTPFRKKDVRNPRVKKRKRFEEKSKRLGSTRAVWKGGEGKGGYGGERTGIKTGLVRSVKL